MYELEEKEISQREVKTGVVRQHLIYIKYDMFYADKWFVDCLRSSLVRVEIFKKGNCWEIDPGFRLTSSHWRPGVAGVRNLLVPFILLPSTSKTCPSLPPIF